MPGDHFGVSMNARVLMRAWKVVVVGVNMLAICGAAVIGHKTLDEKASALSTF